MNRNTESPKAAIMTLGCKVNQYESEAIAEALEEKGFEIVPFDRDADVYIVNSCTVTEESDRKVCQMIRRAAARGRDKDNKPAVLVTGCMAQTQPERAAAIEGVTYVCGSRNKLSCVDAAVAHIEGRAGDTVCNVPPLESCGMERMSLRRTGLERTRAYIKIEDGCENRCTYCAIPNARGLVVSKHPDDVLSEIRDLIANGYREIVLTGIETASYGVDWKRGDDAALADYRLIDLLEAVDRQFAQENVRIRLGSLEPTYMKPETVSRMAALKLLAHHFHLSLQSGADAVLRNMKRKYNMTQVRAIMADIRAKMPDVQFTTDIMTGFPGETEEDFAQTMAFASEARLLHIHVFPYSRRKNTPADKLPDQLDNAEKNRRANALIALQNQIEEDIYREQAELFVRSGETVSFLAETCRDGVTTGHTDNFLEVRVRGDVSVDKEIRSVRIVGAQGLSLIGEII